MARFTWVLAALACAILGALPFLASCETDDPPGPTTDDQSDPACLGEKADDPSCQIAPLQSDPADTTDGSPPDTEQPTPLPTCSESELPYPAGTWMDCGQIAGQCQLEWHDDEYWGCLGTCPPTNLGGRPEDFSNPALGISSCSFANP